MNCPSCHTPTSNQSHFCHQCGHSLDEASPSQQKEVFPSSLAQSTSATQAFDGSSSSIVSKPSPSDDEDELLENSATSFLPYMKQKRTRRFRIFMGVLLLSVGGAFAGAWWMKLGIFKEEEEHPHALLAQVTDDDDGLDYIVGVPKKRLISLASLDTSNPSKTEETSTKSFGTTTRKRKTAPSKNTSSSSVQTKEDTSEQDQSRNDEKKSKPSTGSETKKKTKTAHRNKSKEEDEKPTSKPSPDKPKKEPQKPSTSAVDKTLALQQYGKKAQTLIRKRYTKKAKSCFKQKDQILRGTVTMGITISGSGNIKKSYVVNNTTQNNAVSDCIRKEIKRWNLPAPPHGTLKMQIPFRN